MTLTLAADDVFNSNDLVTLTGDDDEMRRGLRDILSDELPSLLARLDHGFSSGDCVEVKDAAHALRSLVSTVGGRAAFRMAGEIERLAREGNLEAGAAWRTPLVDASTQLRTALSAFVERAL